MAHYLYIISTINTSFSTAAEALHQLWGTPAAGRGQRVAPAGEQGADAGGRGGTVVKVKSGAELCGMNDGI